MSNSIQNLYGNKVRTRACGICLRDNALLMANHKNLVEGSFWAPPGGGVEFGESVHATLEREFREETNLMVKVKELLFVAEFIASPLHAIELFFEVECIGGSLRKGADPEMETENQIITDVQFLSWEEIRRMDQKQLHGIFKYTSEPSKIIDLRGYFKL